MPAHDTAAERQVTEVKLAERAESCGRSLRAWCVGHLAGKAWHATSRPQPMSRLISPVIASWCSTPPPGVIARAIRLAVS